MSSQTLDNQIYSLEAHIKTLSEAVSGDEKLRQRLLGVFREAVAQVESPWDTISRMYMQVR